MGLLLLPVAKLDTMTHASSAEEHSSQQNSHDSSSRSGASPPGDSTSQSQKESSSTQRENQSHHSDTDSKETLPQERDPNSSSGSVTAKSGRRQLSHLPSHPLLLILSFLSPLDAQLFPLSRAIYSAITNILYFHGVADLNEQHQSDVGPHLKHSPSLESLHKALKKKRPQLHRHHFRHTHTPVFPLRPFYEIGGLLAELMPQQNLPAKSQRRNSALSSNSQDASNSSSASTKERETKDSPPDLPLVEGDCGPYLMRYWNYIWYFRSIYKKPVQPIEIFTEEKLRRKIMAEGASHRHHRVSSTDSSSNTASSANTARPQIVKATAFGLIEAKIQDDIVSMHLRRQNTSLSHDFQIVTFHINNILHLSGPQIASNRRKKGEISQWVKQVSKFSSEASGNLSRNLSGYPKTYPRYGAFFKTAWCPSRAGKKEFLELEYDFPVYITGIEIFETYDGGAVQKIQCWHPKKSKWCTLWEKSDSSSKETVFKSRCFSPKLQKTYKFQSKKIRLALSNAQNKCCYIDAIKLKGRKEELDEMTHKQKEDAPKAAENATSTGENATTEHATTAAPAKSVSIFEDISEEPFYHPEAQKHFQQNVRRWTYFNHCPSPMDICGPLMTYIKSDTNGEKQHLTITTTSKGKKPFERPLYLWDFCVASRIRMDNKVLCILKRFKGKIAYYISLWDLSQDIEVLSHPIEECKSHIDLFELADHIIVFARKHTVHVYDSLRKVASFNPSHTTNSEQWRHVRGLAHESKVVSLSLNSDIGLVSDTLATGCVDGSIYLWSLSRGAILHEIQPQVHRKSVAHLQLVAGGTLLCATYLHDPRLFIYDCFTGAQYRSPIRLYDQIGWDKLHFSIDNRFLTAHPVGHNHCILYQFDNSEEEKPAKFNRFGHNIHQDHSSCTIL